MSFLKMNQSWTMGNNETRMQAEAKTAFAGNIKTVCLSIYMAYRRK